MARPDLDLDQDAADPQDQAETADETHLNEDKDEFTTLEEAPNAFDDTARDDDDVELAPTDESEFSDEDDDYEDDEDDTDANDELDDTPDEFQPEVEWAEATEQPGDQAQDAVEDALDADEIEGLNEVGDADSVEGGEDDFTNFQSRRLSDEQLNELGYEPRRSPAKRSD
ncbi:MAG TPA: hypothetical protein VHZ26_13040 [Caulobacteraceae bacterium]|jgi:hypothetical protein|nr:hypothetical protein [Caulobacteraceae bacterium]